MSLSRSMTLALACLRNRLRAVSYSQEAIQRTLGIRYPDDIGLLNRVSTLLRLSSDESSLALALRLFFLEDDVSQRHLAALLSPKDISTLLEANLLLRTKRESRWVLRARLRVDAIGTLLFLADRRFQGFDRGALPRTSRDPVYPVSADSILLQEVVAAVPGGTLLDLCTGSGVQVVTQRQHCSAAHAVDINPRAALMAKLNAELNQIEPIDITLGDLYHPLGRQSFDTIIANPPFVSSPYETGGPSYHAGGPTGDDLLRRILKGWSRHLRANGRGFAVTHVGLKRGRELADIARTWLGSFPGRAAIFELESGSPIDLAAAQALFALEKGIASYNREVAIWVAYLQRHRIERIAAILIAAEKTGRHSIEVIPAHSQVLPLPISPPPKQVVDRWLGQT